MTQNTYKTITAAIREFFEGHPSVNSYFHMYPGVFQYSEHKLPAAILYDSTHLLNFNGADVFNFSVTIIEQCDLKDEKVEDTRNNLIRILKDFQSTFEYGIIDNDYGIQQNGGFRANFVDNFGSEQKHMEAIVYEFSFISNIYEKNNE